jgi:hypothetical protein
MRNKNIGLEIKVGVNIFSLLDNMTPLCAFERQQTGTFCK